MKINMRVRINIKNPETFTTFLFDEIQGSKGTVVEHNTLNGGEWLVELDNPTPPPVPGWPPFTKVWIKVTDLVEVQHETVRQRFEYMFKKNEELYHSLMSELSTGGLCGVIYERSLAGKHPSFGGLVE